MYRRISTGLLIIIAAVCLMLLPGIAGADITPVPIVPDTDVTVDITFPGDAALFSFTPETTGYYVFESFDRGDMDPCAYLFDDHMVQMRFRDDITENDLDFRIQGKLDAGTLYYFGASANAQRDTGSFSVRLYQLNGIFLYNEETLIQATEGKPWKISVDAYSTAGELTYQWYQLGNGQPVPLEGETGFELDIPALARGERKQYRCVLGDAADHCRTVDYTVVAYTGLYVSEYNSLYLQYGENREYTIEAGADYGELAFLWERCEYDKEAGEYVYTPVADTATLPLQNVHEYREYRCSVTDENGYTRTGWLHIYVEHEDFELTADGDTEIEVPAGTEITLKTVPPAQGEGGLFSYSYEWEFYSTGYNYIDYSDNDSNEITVTPLESGQYNCYAYDGCGNERFVTFNVTVISSLTADADGETEIETAPNEQVTMAVTASSTAGGLSFQWYKLDTAFESFFPISGAAGASYTFNAPVSGQYRCRVTDAAGCYKNVFFSLMVNNQFSACEEKPTDLCLAPGESAELKVSASCADGNLTYRWYLYDENGIMRYQPEATGDTFPVTGNGEWGSYRCRVSDNWGNAIFLYFSVSPATPSLQIDAPFIYAKQNLEGSGYAIGITVPESVTTELEDWLLNVWDSNYTSVCSLSSTEGDVFRNPLIIPDASLRAGEHYTAEIRIRYKYYSTFTDYFDFLVTESGANQSIALTIADYDGNVPDPVLMGESYEISAQGDPSIKALAVWKNGFWEYIKGNTYSYGIRAYAGEYHFMAYGTKDEPWEDEGFDEESFDWKTGVEWTEISNSLEFEVEPLGTLAPPVIRLNGSASYTRGDVVSVTVFKTAGANSYTLYMYVLDDSGYLDHRVFYQTVQADGTGEGTVAFDIPTDQLDSGRYRITVSNSGPGYYENSSEGTDLTITGTAPEKAVIRILPEKAEDLWIDEPVTVLAYDPDHTDLTLVISYTNGSESCSSDGSNHYILRDTSFSTAGKYTARLYADGDMEEPVAEAEFFIQDLGKIENVPLLNAPTIHTAGEDYNFSFGKVLHATRYVVQLYNEDDGELLCVNRFTGSGSDAEQPVSICFPGTFFPAAGEYQIEVYAEADRWTYSWTTIAFIVLEPGIVPDNQLRVDLLDEYGEVTDRTEWYSTETIQFRITASDVADVRFWDGRWWEEPEMGEGNCAAIFRSYGGGSYSVVAKARSPQSDTWDIQSNILNFHVTRRVLPTPAFTHNVTDGTVERGQVIRITIGAEPETAGETNPPSPDYEAKIYPMEGETQEYISGWDWDEATRQILIPTDNLAPGSYRIKVTSWASGWEGGTGEQAIEFILTEPASVPAIFRTDKTSARTGETVEIIYCQAGANAVGISIDKDGEYFADHKIYSEIGLWPLAFTQAGIYTVTPYAYDENGDRMDNTPEPIEVQVASSGQLGNIRMVQEIPEFAEAGQPLPVRFEAVPGADTYGIVLEYSEALSGESYTTVLDTAVAREAGATQISTVISGDRIDGAGMYRLTIEARGIGYEPNSATFEFRAFAKGTGVLRLPEGLERIEDNAFENGAFGAVIIPEGCTYIGHEAFKNCGNLVYVSYKEGTVIEDDAFTGCPWAE